MFKGDNVTLAHHNFSRLMVEFKPLSYRVHKEVHLGSITKANVGGKVAANLSMNALDVGACTWLPDASSRWPGRGENKAHGCFDRVTKSTKTRKQKKKESSLTAQGTRSTGPLRHSTLHQIWEVSPESGWWFNISGNTRWNGVQKRGGKIIYIYNITTMQNRELLFKYRTFLDFSTLEKFPHRRLCTDVSFSTCGNQYKLFLWEWDWCL